ncbi:MAG TPA: HlyD family efflux transporter periplasmic adaptor subunit [Candidatus Acidoferrales bacterium]|nr:HlyD family efflux transporter periplasmic adaptor subunit [Candidatus Acidoferrales bacterium]
MALALCACSQFDVQALWPGSARRAAADVAPLVRPQQLSIAARGRLQPAGGVLRVAGPSLPGAVIGALNVREGDWVTAGQVVAVLEGTAAQQALVRRLTAEAWHAATELRRTDRLFHQGIVSAAERDTAQTQADVAHAELARTQAELDASNVRAPAEGRVLTIHTHTGERIGADGVLDLGNTTQMEVVAEVYETDIAAVRVGQAATVTAAAVAEPLTGTVERIGLTIGKQSIFEIDPAADTDARVVEVHIRLHAGDRVATLTNLQVDVELGA